MWRLFIAFLILLPVAGFAAIYQWTDKQGNLHFSDKPHRGAKRIKLSPTQIYHTPKGTTENNANKQGRADKLRVREYQTVAISQPENSATIRNNQGYVAVSVDLEPALMNGDRVVIILDGMAVGKPHTNVHFSLSGINRGTHTLIVKIIDEAGVTIAESESIVFHMRRPKVGGG